MAADIAIGVQLVALAEISERANHKGALARTLSLHRPSSLFVLAMLAVLGAPVNAAARWTAFDQVFVAYPPEPPDGDP